MLTPLTLSVTAGPPMDYHPYRPDRVRYLLAHLLCCLSWYVPAGHCTGQRFQDDKTRQTNYRAGSAAESTAAEKADLERTVVLLPPELRLRAIVIIERGASVMDADGRYKKATPHTETSWAIAARRHHIRRETMQQYTADAPVAIARALGWRPIG